MLPLFFAPLFSLLPWSLKAFFIRIMRKLQWAGLAHVVGLEKIFLRKENKECPWTLPKNHLNGADENLENMSKPYLLKPRLDEFFPLQHQFRCVCCFYYVLNFRHIYESDHNWTDNKTFLKESKRQQRSNSDLLEVSSWTDKRWNNEVKIKVSNNNSFGGNLLSSIRFFT